MRVAVYRRALLLALLLVFALPPAPVLPASAPAPGSSAASGPAGAPASARSVSAGLSAASLPVPSGVSLVVRSGASARGYDWPLRPAPPQVTRRFDPPPQPWLAGHRGVDLAGRPAAVVRSAGAGVVHFAGRVGGRPVVSVAHPGGLRTTYEPVVSDLAVGAVVAVGDPLGELEGGHQGCPVEACLHWGLRRGEEYLDPLALLGLGRVRLLPTG